jgi:hypothetical protein
VRGYLVVFHNMNSRSAHKGGALLHTTGPTQPKHALEGMYCIMQYRR